MNIFRSPIRPLFRSSLVGDSELVLGLCEELGEVYATRDLTRPGHFTSYFRVLTLREEPRFPNAILADLYTLHELWHFKFAYPLSLPGEKLSWLDWVRRRVASEFQASLLSECLVYFHVPGLREHTFDHEIWVDRFLYLRDRPMHSIEQTIAGERRRALATPAYDDFIEYQIHSYGRQNMLWCRTWAEPVGTGPNADLPAFRVVEQRLAQPDWAADHADWLKQYSEGGIPFARQAEAFQAIYEGTNGQWGNQYLRR